VDNAIETNLENCNIAVKRIPRVVVTFSEMHTQTKVHCLIYQFAWLFILRLTVAQNGFNDPWITPPLPNSTAFPYVKLASIDTSGATLQILENCPNSAIIAVLSYTGSAPILTCYLSTQLSGSSLVLKQVLDYDYGIPSYVCTFRTTGIPPEFRSLEVTVLDVNDEQPRLGLIVNRTGSISEDALEDTRVYPFNITATDPDTKANLTFEINWASTVFSFRRSPIEVTEAMKNCFKIVTVGNAKEPFLSTGSIVVGSYSLDRETFDLVELWITVEDLNTEINSRIDEIFLNIYISDVNDNDPYFDPDGPFVFEVPENTRSGVYIGTLQAFDVDLANKITYVISSCEGNGTFYVQINETSGRITVKEPIDHELTPIISCTVNAADNGIPSRNKQADLIINVIDLNDNPPIFEELSSEFDPITIAEDTENGTVIGFVHATDADSDDFGLVTYLFYERNTEGGDHFAVDPGTGNITVNLINGAELDFDTHPNFSFEIEGRDYYRPGFISGSNSARIKINVKLTDFNDNPPILPPNTTADECFSKVFENLLKDAIIVTIIGTDKDEPNTDNSKIEYSLDLQEAIRPTPDLNGKTIFRIDTANNTGILSVETANLNGLSGKYKIDVTAHDFGTPRQNSTLATYTICVEPFNVFTPEFVFPGATKAVDVFENSTKGEILRYRASDTEMLPLQFTAEDKDTGDNGKISYFFTPSFNNPTEIFSCERDGSIFLVDNFNRSFINKYTISVRAEDSGLPEKKFNDSLLEIFVRVSSQNQPIFTETNMNIKFTENRLNVSFFNLASDPDNINLLPGETNQSIFYYVIDGNMNNFAVQNPEKAELSVIDPLDREDPPPFLYTIIEASNFNPRPNTFDCSKIDCTTASYLNISITILDENDCPPVFPLRAFSSGISNGDKKDKDILTISSTDADENDRVNYVLSEPPFSSDGSLGIAKPFDIDPISQKLKLNFDVSASMKGFIRLNVTAFDLANNTASTDIKIYVVREENKVVFLFNNDKNSVEERRANIEEIFSTVYELRCNIEQVSSENVDENLLSQTTTIVSHFVNEAEDQPVLSNIIEGYKNDINKTTELRKQLQDIFLNLVSIQSLSNTIISKVDVYKILFIVLCVVLVLAIVLLIFLIVRGNKLNHRVKALTSTKFGSQDSGINRIGVAVPNSNKHAIEGSNPIWNDTAMENPQDDNISQSSGDSVLIGVEDNPEFRNYKGGRQNHGFQHENASLPYRNVVRRNPLAEISERSTQQEKQAETQNVAMSKPKRSAPPPPSSFVNGDTINDEFQGYSDDSDHGNEINSNFSFSKM